MSFRTNDSQQISMFDSFNVLTEREQKALVRSWAKVFAEEIFPTIDDEVVENLMLDFRFRYALHTTSSISEGSGALCSESGTCRMINREFPAISTL